MATSDSPRAIVLVKACCRTFTALSQGELACAKAGTASIKQTIMLNGCGPIRRNKILWRALFMAVDSPSDSRYREVPATLTGGPRRSGPSDPVLERGCVRCALRKVVSDARNTRRKLPHVYLISKSRCKMCRACAKRFLHDRATASQVRFALPSSPSAPWALLRAQPCGAFAADVLFSVVTRSNSRQKFHCVLQTSIRA